ncbi:MAG: GNAT family N-acetyltransferase [Ornithinimicrobium sp.]
MHDSRVSVDPDGFRLATQRAVIRPWHPSDAPRLFDIRRRPEIAQWLDHPDPWPSEHYTKERIESWRREATPSIPGPCAIVPAGGTEVVGGVSLVTLAVSGRISPADPRLSWLGGRPIEDAVQIGWLLHPEHVGQGWASEAAGAMLRYARSQGHRRIWALMWASNVASAAVCARIGMQDLGTGVDPWYGTSDDPTSRAFIWER